MFIADAGAAESTSEAATVTQAPVPWKNTSLNRPI
jgi:hypothetical protein